MIGNISQSTGGTPFTIQRAMQKDSKESLEKDASKSLTAQSNGSTLGFAQRNTQLNQLAGSIQSEMNYLKADRASRSVNAGGIVAETTVDSKYIFSALANKRGLDAFSNMTKDNILSASQDTLEKYKEYIEEKANEATTPTEEGDSLEMQIAESSEEALSTENADSTSTSASEVSAAPAPDVASDVAPAQKDSTPAAPVKTSVNITV